MLGKLIANGKLYEEIRPAGGRNVDSRILSHSSTTDIQIEALFTYVHLTNIVSSSWAKCEKGLICYGRSKVFDVFNHRDNSSHQPKN